jgi:dTDP-4-dehydrorhamnose reductase
MKILVTGAGGLLGRACVEIASPRHECVGLRRRELDVTDRSAVDNTFEHIGPDAVIHCAAYTDVDGAERDPARAMAVNADGTEWVARAARRAVMLYVSTDYVFDGEKQTPYIEEDATHPLSKYAESKLEGERRVSELSPDGSIIVRSGWLYGRGKGFVDWALRRLEAGEVLRSVADQVGSPTWVKDLAKALLVLLEKRLSGTFHVVNRGQTDWLGAARVLAELTGADASLVEGISLAELGRPAPRPRYSALDVSKFEGATGVRLQSWEEALSSYVGEKRS